MPDEDWAKTWENILEIVDDHILNFHLVNKYLSASLFPVPEGYSREQNGLLPRGDIYFVKETDNKYIKELQITPPWTGVKKWRRNRTSSWEWIKRRHLDRRKWWESHTNIWGKSFPDRTAVQRPWGKCSLLEIVNVIVRSTQSIFWISEKK